MRRIRRFKAGKVEPGSSVSSVSWPLFPVNYAWRRQGSTKSGVPPRMFLANYFVKVERKGRHQILFARAMRIQSEIHCFFWADGVEWKNLRPEKREERSFRKTINGAAEISWDAT
jgi:hypothetical protein